MARFSLHDGSLLSRKGLLSFLAFTFLAGIITGCFLYLSAEFDSVSWMRGTMDVPVSIVGLLSVILLPFLFSAFAVYSSQQWLLLPIAFWKALSFAQVACGISAAFGSAGWLMRFLLMFTDTLSLPLLVLFWVRYGGGGRMLTIASAFAYLGAVAIIGSVDFLFISPLLAGL